MPFAAPNILAPTVAESTQWHNLISEALSDGRARTSSEWTSMLLALRFDQSRRGQQLRVLLDERIAKAKKSKR